MVRVNDRHEIEWHEGMTVRDLLKACNFTFPLINVTLNGTLIPKDQYDHTLVNDGDEVRVIHLITGG